MNAGNLWRRDVSPPNQAAKARQVYREILHDEAKRALRDLAGFEQLNGKAATVDKYGGPTNSERVRFNSNFESILGPVDVDWMLTLAPLCPKAALQPVDTFALGSVVPQVNSDDALRRAIVQCGGVYLFAKPFWNVARSVLSRGKIPLEFESVSEPGNRNAPLAAALWLNSDETLTSIFAPSLGQP